MRGEWSGSGSRVKRSMGRQPFGWVDSRLALSTAAHYGCRSVNDLGGPGGDLLSRVLRHSTISAEGFNGRVRDGIGFGPLAPATGPAKIVGDRQPLQAAVDRVASNAGGDVRRLRLVRREGGGARSRLRAWRPVARPCR